MSAYSDLRARGNLSGSAYRPSGSDGYWPPVGATVPWVLSQPIQDLLDQGKALGWDNLGTIGNEEHRKRHGDHTPWSAGKARQILYAKDTEDPSWLLDCILRLCRMPDYDTRWIDFLNCNGGQYDNSGNRVGDSGDTHLHVNVNAGFELTHVSLFFDANALHNGTFGKADDMDGTTPVPYYDSTPAAGQPVAQTITYNAWLGSVSSLVNGISDRTASLVGAVAGLQAAVTAMAAGDTLDTVTVKMQAAETAATASERQQLDALKAELLAAIKAGPPPVDPPPPVTVDVDSLAEAMVAKLVERAAS